MAPHPRAPARVHTHVSARLALTLAFALALAPAAQARPNIVVLMTDDQTFDSMSVLPKTRDLIGAQGATFTRSFANYSLCCPSRSTFYTGPVRPQPRRDHQHAPQRRLHPPRHLQLAPALAAARRLPDHARRQVPERLWPRRSADVPPGFNDWHGTVDPSTYSYYGFTVYENGVLRTYPGVYSTDFIAGRADELIAAAAPSKQPFFMSVAFLAPHSGRPARARRSARHRDRRRSRPSTPTRSRALPLPTPASFNEADMSDKPLAMQARPPIGAVRAVADPGGLPAAARVAAVG